MLFWLLHNELHISCCLVFYRFHNVFISVDLYLYAPYFSDILRMNGSLDLAQDH